MLAWRQVRLWTYDHRRSRIKCPAVAMFGHERWISDIPDWCVLRSQIERRVDLDRKYRLIRVEDMNYAALEPPLSPEKFVAVAIDRSEDALRFTISDQGAGFQWQPYLHFDPERILDPNGKGIAIARRHCFDALDYRGNGNTVVATIRL